MKTVKRAPRARPAKPGRRPRRGRVQLIVQYATRAPRVPSARKFRQWVDAAMPENARITVRVVALSEGRSLNRNYRGRDYATNVLTFVLEDAPPYDGDLALCAAVISREAREQGKDVIAHYAHLTVHGVLHLRGYEHEREPEADA